MRVYASVVYRNMIDIGWSYIMRETAIIRRYNLSKRRIIYQRQKKKKEERRKKEKDINEAAKRRKQSFVRTVLRFLLSDILCSAFSSAFAIP